MNISPTSFVSLDELLNEITTQCQDRDFRSGFTRGYYMSRIKVALEEMALDSLYLEGTIDMDIDQECLQVNMPNEMFNVHEIYVYNETCCSPTSSSRVYWKRQFNNRPGGMGYTSTVKDTASGDLDPITPRFYNNHGGSLKYANMQNGIVMLSDSCSGYSKIRFIGNMFDGDPCEVPCVPRWFRRACVDWVCEEYFRFQLASKNPVLNLTQASKLHQIYDDRLNGRGRDLGSWKKAEIRVKKMDEWEKDSMNEYLSKKW